MWLNVLAALAGLSILVAGFGLVNSWRQRSLWSFPEQVGFVELAAFVLIPAFLPVIFGGQWQQFFGSVVDNLVLVWLIYLVVGYARRLLRFGRGVLRRARVGVLATAEARRGAPTGRRGRWGWAAVVAPSTSERWRDAYRQPDASSAGGRRWRWAVLCSAWCAGH